jgi:hypothetical protein
VHPEIRKLSARRISSTASSSIPGVYLLINYKRPSSLNDTSYFLSLLFSQRLEPRRELSGDEQIEK